MNTGKPHGRIQDFPLGGMLTHWGGTDLRRIHFLAKTYVKTKEMDPVGGMHAGGAPLDPPMILYFFHKIGQ